jgi:hypothetical protein
MRARGRGIDRRRKGRRTIWKDQDIGGEMKCNPTIGLRTNGGKIYVQGLLLAPRYHNIPHGGAGP